MLGRRRQQDHARFEALVNAYSKDLYRYALWLCSDRVTAEDLVQETFARAWRAFDTLREGEAVKSWLMTIVRREHARLFERRRPELTDMDFDVLPSTASEGSPSAEALALRRALAALPADYREPLVLQVLGGCTGEEIAAVMDISPSAAMTRLHRARRKLRATLGDEVSPASAPRGAGVRRTA